MGLVESHPLLTVTRVGITFVWDGIRHALRDDNLHFWHKHFMTFGNPNAPYTLEAQTAGLRIVFTADPENIKAILATQFNDFGKGEEFNKDFHEFLGDSTSRLVKIFVFLKNTKRR